MGKRQEKGHSRAGQSAGKSDNGIWINALTAIVIALLGICSAFGVIGWQLISQAGEQQAQTRQAETAKALTGYFNSRVNDMRRSLSSAGASTFAAHAVTKNREQRLEASEQLKALLPHARRVDIIPRGQAEVDLNADTPISFAALDVIKRAESAEFVGPEAAIGKRNVFYAASPVTRNGVVAGVLFVAFSHDFLLEPMSVAFDPGIGTVSLLQKFEGTASVPVLEWGISGQDGVGSTTLPLSVPQWQLQFQSTSEAADASSSWQSLLMPLGLAAGLTLGGIGLGFSRLSKKMLDDAERLKTHGGALLRGRRPKKQNYALPLFQQIAGSLENETAADNTSGGKAAAVVGGAIAASAAASADDPDEVAALLADDDGFLDVAETTKPAPAKKARPSEEDENFGIEVTEEDEGPVESGLDLDAEIFRAYDIRGITKTNLTEDVVYWIGRAFAAEAATVDQTRCAIGRDGRLSSPALARALTRGLTEGGIDVIDIGQVPTPLLYFATHALDTGTGIMITGSHNPPDYNGLKMMLAGTTLAEERIKVLEARIRENNLSEGHGKSEEVDIVPAYMERVLDDVAIAQSLKVVVDCGNGVAGDTVPALLEDLGCEVIPLYCEVDGTFPNHHPDPAEPENLEDLITVVKAENADLGLAFDGDGDRLGVVTPKGEIIWPDKLMMLFSQDIVSRNPGADIIFDIKCSRHLNNLISEYGGRPIMWKTGHSHIKAKMKETGALLGGEFSGHVCFGERWYGFDDALYSAARLLEIVSAESVDIDELFAQFPITFSTPEIKIQTTEREKFEIMGKLEQSADFGEGTITAIDGIRVDFDDAWGLVRPSNTSPVLSLRFEADGQSALDRVQNIFQEQLLAISPALKFRE